MSLLEELIQTGRLIDVVLILVVIEVLALLGWRALRGSGIRALPLLVNIGAGGSLMLALREALTTSRWQWIAGFLVLSLCFHTADIVVRWQTRTQATD